MKIGILEDDLSLRRQWKALLESCDIYTILEASNIGELAMSVSPNEVPDILLVDIMLGEDNALNSLFVIRRLMPYTKILICSGYSAKEFVDKAIHEHVDGYFLKGSNPELLIKAIHDIYDGGAYLSSPIAKILIDTVGNDRNQKETRFNLEKIALDYSLVPRETDVLIGLIDGKRYKEIANDNFISINTIRHYVMTLYRKFQVSNRISLLKKIHNINPG